MVRRVIPSPSPVDLPALSPTQRLDHGHFSPKSCHTQKVGNTDGCASARRVHGPHNRSGGLSAAARTRPWVPCSDCQAIWMLWFFSGNERMRWPVALKYALSTAGAATQIVGSPTPPHGSLPPDSMMIDST